MLRFVSLFLVTVATATSLECYDCQMQTFEGHTTYYTIDVSEPVRVRGCPTRACVAVPGGACVKASYTKGEEQWEYNACSSTFTSQCEDIAQDDCEVLSHCTTDLCNAPGPTLPTQAWPTVEGAEASDDSPLLSLPVIIGISVAVAVLCVVVLVGVGYWCKTRHDERKKGKFQRITEAVKDIVTED